MTNKFDIFPYRNGKRTILKKGGYIKLDANIRKIMNFIQTETQYFSTYILINTKFVIFNRIYRKLYIR